MSDPVAFLKTLIAAQHGGESAVQHLVAEAARGLVGGHAVDRDRRRGGPPLDVLVVD